MAIFLFLTSLIFPFLVLVLTLLLNPHIASSTRDVILLYIVYFVTYGIASFVINFLGNLCIKRVSASYDGKHAFKTCFIIPVILLTIIMCYGFRYNAEYFHDAISESSYKLLNTSGNLCLIGSIVLFFLLLFSFFWKFNLKKYSLIVVLFLLFGIFNTMVLVKGYERYPFGKASFERRDTKMKVSIIGLDALSWEIVEPMMTIGYMPNLARLKKHSTWGSLETLTPTKSNVVWTSIATGKKPVKHNIKSFFKYDFILLKTPLTILPKNLFMMLFLNLKLLHLETVNAEERNAAPLWNITGSGKREGTAVVNWWSSIPPDSINGVDFSNYIYYLKAGYDEKFDFEVTYPAFLAEYSDIFEVKDDSYVKNFITGDPKGIEEDFVYKYIKDRIYKEDKFYFRAGKYIFKKYKPACFLFYHNGTDPIAHYFLKYFNASNSNDSPSREFKAFYKTMESYYDYVDSELSDFLMTDDERIFIFLSDHGMVSTPLLIRMYRNYIVKNPYLYGYHDDPIKGLFMIAGPPIKRDHLMDSASVYDIAPTALYLLGYPVAEDMDGKVLQEAIKSGFLSKFKIEAIKSYDYLNKRRSIEKRKVFKGEGTIEKLKSLGYF